MKNAFRITLTLMFCIVLCLVLNPVSLAESTTCVSFLVNPVGMNAVLSIDGLGSTVIQNQAPYVFSIGTTIKIESATEGYTNILLTASHGTISGNEYTVTNMDDEVTIIFADAVIGTITFNSNGGEGNMTPQVISSSNVKLSKNKFYYDTRVFVGWNTEPDGSGISYLDGSEITVNNDLTLYAQWAEDIAICEDVFPDAVFRSYISENFDTNRDGYLSEAEIDAVTVIDYIGNARGSVYDPFSGDSYSFENSTISTLKGIEYFSALQKLVCCCNPLTELDLSGCPALSELDCSVAELTNLDVSHCPALTSLKCYSNKLTSLDLSNNATLAYLDCNWNELTILDPSKNEALTYLNCSNNKLSALPLENCSEILELYCNDNQLVALEVGICPALSKLNCANNAFISLDINENTALAYLYCYGNQLTSLDISCCPAIVDLVGSNSPTVSRFNSQIAFSSENSGFVYDSWTMIQTGEAGCPLNNANFPDAVFHSYVADKIDLNADGNLSDEEIAAVTWIDCSGTEEERGTIQTMKGVEFFTELVMLDCSSNQLGSLDLRQNNKLEVLDCSNNQMTRLNIGDNTALTTVWCYNNRLKTLDLSWKNALTELWCNNNWLEALDLSEVPNLRVLWCHDNRLTALDPSSCAELVTLSCAINNLSELDVSMNSRLSTLWCENNGISLLDLTNNSELRNLRCYANLISELNLFPCPALMSLIRSTSSTVSDGIVRYFDESSSDPVYLLYDDGVSLFIQVINEEIFPDPAFREYVATHIDNNKDGILCDHEISKAKNISVSALGITSLKGIEWFTSLQTLHCENNSLCDLNLSGCTGLTTVYVNSNSLTSLELGVCPALTTLYCTDNVLTELDASAYPALNMLDCSNNLLTDIDLSQNSQLRTLNCNDNLLRDLNLSNNSALTVLHCQRNLLIALNLKGNTTLTTLSCGGNNLSELNVSGCDKLKTLSCEGNELTKLGLGGCDALVTLTCGGNAISELDLNDFPALRRLSCANNSLTTLDISGCSRLTMITCQNNELSQLKVSDCPALKTLTCQHNALTELDLSDCPALLTLIENIDPLILDSVVTYSASSQNNALLSFDVGILLNMIPNPDFVLPTALTEISEEAFAGGVFRYVKLSGSTTTIGPNAFADCPNLGYIEIPNADTVIDENAFGERTSLTIIGVSGSTAADYAKNHAFIFIPAT